MPDFSNEAALVDDVQQRLVLKFAQLPADQVSTAVSHAHERFAESRVRDFVPLLVERRAAAELASQAAS